MSDAFLYVALAALIIFIGNHGHNAGWWGFYVYAFVFCSLAGLLFGLGVLNMFFPGVSFIKQLVISFAMTTASVVLSLILLKLMQPRS